MDTSIDIRAGDDIRLRELLEALWRGRLLIAAIVAAFSIVAAVAALVLPKQYEAVVVLLPVSDADAAGTSKFGGVGSLAAQFGGLASLAGLDIGDGALKRESLAVLQSYALTTTFIRRNKLLPVLYADVWDENHGTWTTTDRDDVPTLWKANEYFRERIRTVSSENKTGLVTLTIAWKDPETAAAWANGIVALANDQMRTRAIAESERNVAFLNEQAKKTDVVGVRQAISAILETELNRAMLARGREEYALKVIDPAVPPEEPASPQLLTWVLIGFFLGLIVSAIVVFVRLAWARG